MQSGEKGDELAVFFCFVFCFNQKENHSHSVVLKHCNTVQ